MFLESLHPINYIIKTRFLTEKRTYNRGKNTEDHKTNRQLGRHCAKLTQQTHRDCFA